WRFTSDVVRTSASPKTWGWRRTILAAIASLTSVRSKTPSSAASCAWRITWRRRSQLTGERRRGARAERVVDLVGLLEQVIAERLVGLLAIPRAAVRLAQPIGDPGHRPRAGQGGLGANRAEKHRRRERVGVELADRRGRRGAEPPNRMVRRIEAIQDRDRIVAARAVPTRERAWRVRSGGAE